MEGRRRVGRGEWRVAGGGRGEWRVAGKVGGKVLGRGKGLILLTS